MKSRIISVLLLIALTAAVIAVNVVAQSEESIDLTILMYHDLDEVGDSVVTISTERFEEQMEFLDREGYRTVSFDELISYTNGELELPEKCIAVVFDDGYESNYQLAFPILKDHEIKATICLIGSCVGKDTYKDTGAPMNPYLGWEMAREMTASGLVAFGSHTYDMHQYAPLEPGIPRESAIPFEGEPAEDFVSALTDDYRKNSELIREKLGIEPTVFAYPNGRYTELSEQTIRSLGAKVTLTTRVGGNRILRGKPESLFLLCRYNINEATDLSTMRSYINGRCY